MEKETIEYSEYRYAVTCDHCPAFWDVKAMYEVPEKIGTVATGFFCSNCGSTQGTIQVGRAMTTKRYGSWRWWRVTDVKEIFIPRIVEKACVGKYKMVVSTLKEKEELLATSKYLHDLRYIDTSFDGVNLFAHLYLSPEIIIVEKESA